MGGTYENFILNANMNLPTWWISELVYSNLNHNLTPQHVNIRYNYSGQIKIAVLYCYLTNLDSIYQIIQKRVAILLVFIFLDLQCFPWLQVVSSKAGITLVTGDFRQNMEIQICKTTKFMSWISPTFSLFCHPDFPRVCPPVETDRGHLPTVHSMSTRNVFMLQLAKSLILFMLRR